MGITSFSRSLISRVLDNNDNMTTVLELGAQNLYDQDYPGGPPYANGLYEKRSMEYTCIDLSGENNALVFDLSEPCATSTPFDLVTDFGTSEHVLGIYECWKTKWESLRVGGVMINENPKVGNWPDHGYWYYTTEFYKTLATLLGAEIIELGEHPAMGNEKDGWNVYCILRKVKDTPFMDESFFESCGISQGGKQVPQAAAPVPAKKPAAKRKAPSKKKATKKGGASSAKSSKAKGKK